MCPWRPNLLTQNLASRLVSFGLCEASGGKPWAQRGVLGGKGGCPEPQTPPPAIRPWAAHSLPLQAKHQKMSTKWG